MEKPGYAGIESIDRGGNAVDQAFDILKAELTKAFNHQIAVIETKLKNVMAENERLHHERIILARELHRRRAQESKILEIYGVKNGH